MLRNVPLAVCFPDLCTTNILVASNLLCRLNQAALLKHRALGKLTLFTFTYVMITQHSKTNSMASALLP